MALIKCPACGEPMSDTVEKCIHCGIQVVKCFECGTIVDKEAAACPNCGVALKGAQAEVLEECEEPIAESESASAESMSEEVAEFEEDSIDAEAAEEETASEEPMAEDKTKIFTDFAYNWRQTFVGKVHTFLDKFSKGPTNTIALMITRAFYLVLAAIVILEIVDSTLDGGWITALSVICLILFPIVLLISNISTVMGIIWGFVLPIQIPSYVKGKGLNHFDILRSGFAVDIDSLDSKSRISHFRLVRLIYFFSKPHLILSCIFGVIFRLISLVISDAIFICVYVLAILKILLPTVNKIFEFVNEITAGIIAFFVNRFIDMNILTEEIGESITSYGSYMGYFAVLIIVLVFFVFITRFMAKHNYKKSIEYMEKNNCIIPERYYSAFGLFDGKNRDYRRF
jgi:hypothetical protein